MPIKFINASVTGGGGDSSPLTDKGDIYTFSTVNARLAVGADGYVLKADSSTATGLIWGPNTVSTPTKTVTISPSGADYTTIQAALNANTAGGELFQVFPGTYSDTINFTANNQCVKGIGNAPQQIVQQADTTVCDFGAFTGCFVERINLKLTAPTAARTLITGSGVCLFQLCRLEVVQSAAITGTQSTILTTTGTVRMYLTTNTYVNTSTATGSDTKAVLSIGTSGALVATSTEFEIANTGTCLGSTLAIITNATGSIDLSDSKVTLSENTGIAAGLGYLAVGGVYDVIRNTFIITALAANVAYGAYVAGSTELQSSQNHYHITSSSGSAYGFYGGASATIDSQMDDVIAADDDNIQSGCTFTQVASKDNGNLNVTGDITNSVTNSGIKDPSKLAITYNATNRQFTVVNSGTSVNSAGVNSVPVNETTTAHADTTDQYWAVYPSGATTLTITTSPDFSTQAIADRQYYNTDQGAAKAIGFEERHSQQISAKAHQNEHLTIGAKLVVSPMGCDISSYVYNSNNDADLQFALSSGRMFDEDIAHTLTALASGGYTVAYRMGLDSANRMDWLDSQALPFTVATTFCQWNENSGGTWQLTDMTNRDRINLWVFGWTRTDNTRDIVIFPGTSVFGNDSDAYDEGVESLSLPAGFAPEQVPLYQITVRSRTAYSTTGKVQIRRIKDLRGKYTGAAIGEAPTTTAEDWNTWNGAARTSDGSITSTDNLDDGTIVRYRATGGDWVYGQSTDVTTNVHTLFGAPCTTSYNDEFQYSTKIKAKTIQLIFATTWAEASSTTLIEDIYELLSGLQFLGTNARILGIEKVKEQSQDTGVNEPRIGITVNGNQVLTANSNNGIEPTTSFTNSGVGLNITNCVLGYGDAIEATTDANGSNNDAFGLVFNIVYIEI
ncbi:MAG: hypothetical protein GY853_14340 [PVC group bacterium]|nr:hypothetical protein [PVC group bacterium]